MNQIEELVVREFFEQHGFFARAAPTPSNAGRRKSPADSLDLLVTRMDDKPPDRPPGFFLFPTELTRLRRGVVMLRGWQTLRGNPPPRTSAQVHRFIQQTILKILPAETEQTEVETEPPGDWTRVLVLPHLPTAEPFRTQSTEALAARGIGGIISFRGMLADLTARADGGGPFPSSTLARIIRLLKDHDLIRDAQLELFPERNP